MMGDVAVIEINGRMEPYQEGDELVSEVEKILKEGPNRIALNVQKVSFISSLGVGSLINAQRLVQKKDGALCLINPSYSVRQILDVSKLSSLFATYGDEREALEALRSGALTATKGAAGE
jgi:anti-sigma B factor antagonist